MSASDHPAVARLCEQELTLDRDAANVLSVVLQRPVIGMVAERGSRLIGACIGSVGERGGPMVSGPASPPGDLLDGYLDLLVVDRDEQGQGTGRRLVSAVEQELAARGCGRIRVGGHSPWYAWPGIDVRYTPAVCFAEGLGYRRGSCEVDMQVDLATAPLDTTAGVQRLRAVGIVVRRAGPADDGPLQDALAGPWPTTWATEVGAALRRPDGGVHIAQQNSRYVAFCAYGVNRPHEIGPIGTDPGLRHLGIGAIVLRHCLSEQRDRGLAIADIGWVGPVAFFSRAVAATISRAFWCYAKEIS
ncbi:MAG TPA: GNAT family N-acetyltransferase [Streptosporangiaceae bacterium]|nr:GNAT family N-acetyltransferase [Streptosporangiaceae bacterium]